MSHETIVSHPLWREIKIRVVYVQFLSCSAVSVATNYLAPISDVGEICDIRAFFCRIKIPKMSICFFTSFLSVDDHPDDRLFCGLGGHSFPHYNADTFRLHLTARPSTTSVYGGSRPSTFNFV